MTFTLYVKPVNHLSEDCIRTVFSEFGRVTDIHIPRSYHTRKRKPFGYVKFDDKHAAARAIEGLNEKELNGRVMQVVWSDQKRKTPKEMVERKRERREEWLQKNPTKSSTRKADLPLHQQFFTAVNYPPGIGEQYIPMYQRNVPRIDSQRFFFSWVYVPDEVKERIIEEYRQKTDTS